MAETQAGKKPRVTKEEAAQMRKLYRMGKSVTSIARMMKRSVGAVQRQVIVQQDPPAMNAPIDPPIPTHTPAPTPKSFFVRIREWFNS